MKKLIFGALLTIIAFASCTKDDEADPRDKFTGTYQASQTLSIPSLDIYDVHNYTQIIRKASDENYIEVGSEGGEYMKAKVSGSGYVYDKHTSTENYQGETMTFVYNGSGTIEGDIIKENGTVTIYAFGETFNGTWQVTMIR